MCTSSASKPAAWTYQSKPAPASGVAKVPHGLYRCTPDTKLADNKPWEWCQAAGGSIANNSDGTWACKRSHNCPFPGINTRERLNRRCCPDGFGNNVWYSNTTQCSAPWTPADGNASTACDAVDGEVIRQNERAWSCRRDTNKWCSPLFETVANQSYFWAQTRGGEQLVQPCPDRFMGELTRRCQPASSERPAAWKTSGECNDASKLGAADATGKGDSSATFECEVTETWEIIASGVMFGLICCIVAVGLLYCVTHLPKCSIIAGILIGIVCGLAFGIAVAATEWCMPWFLLLVLLLLLLLCCCFMCVVGGYRQTHMHVFIDIVGDDFEDGIDRTIQFFVKKNYTIEHVKELLLKHLGKHLKVKHMETHHLKHGHKFLEPESVTLEKFGIKHATTLHLEEHRVEENPMPSIIEEDHYEATTFQVTRNVVQRAESQSESSSSSDEEDPGSGLDMIAII